MKNLTLRLPDELRKALEQNAEAADRKLADYIRHVLKIIVENGLTPYDLEQLAEGDEQ
jgi:hypothetical protein